MIDRSRERHTPPAAKVASTPTVACEAADETAPLFRPAAVAERHAQWLGTVLLAQRPSHTFFAVFGALAVAAIAALFMYADLTRKARMGGWLIPEEGVARTSASTSGVVTQLEAHLYSPGSAVGFLRVGQPVRLRYDAYPHQKFGHHEGVIASISRAAISPKDLPPQLASHATPRSAESAATPTYRVTVKLASQTVAAPGESVPLEAGMLLEADVALEKRRLYAWVFEPFMDRRRQS
jgi:Cation efflux system protein CusB domain 1